MKSILFTIFILGTLSLTSCRKNWNCECSGNEIIFPYYNDLEITERKKNDAQVVCDHRENYLKDFDNNVKCELKEN